MIHLGRREYGKAWDSGYSFGEGIQDTISNFDPANLFNIDIPDTNDIKTGGYDPSHLSNIF